MVKKGSVKQYEYPPTSELPEIKLRYNFRLGDLTWVKLRGSSWWPAQVIDEACVSSKPEKKTEHDCLVRVYGSCEYLYVDPLKSNTEFEMMLKRESKSAMEVFRESLEKERSHVNSSRDYDEEGGNSEGTRTKVTTAKTSSSKGRKQQGLKQCNYKGVKKAATTESLEDESEDQGQVGSTAAPGATIQKGKSRRGRESSSSHDTAQTSDKVSCHNSAESSRGKRQKQVAHVLANEGSKIGASVVRREGLRRSTRANAKEYLDAAEDGTASLSSHDTAQTTGKVSCHNSAESSRCKRQNQVGHVLANEGSKIGASVVRREGLRRSARANAKEYLDAAEDGTASLSVTGASEDATENSMVDGTPAPHMEIKAMVRDILFKEIIERERDAEMAYVDEVINGICNSTVDSVLGSAAASSKVGQGIKQSGSGADGESRKVTLRKRKGKSDQETEDTMQVTSQSQHGNHTTKNGNASTLKEVIDTAPSRDVKMNELEPCNLRQTRQTRIMQSLGLMAPSGSPFGKNRPAPILRKT